MNKFFGTHSETILISSAVFFLVVIVGFLYGTLTVVFSEIDRAIGSVSVQSATGFDLQSAAKIDFRGLLGGGAAQAPIPLPRPLPLPVVVVTSTAPALAPVATTTVSATSTPVVPTSTNTITVTTTSISTSASGTPAP